MNSLNTSAAWHSGRRKGKVTLDDMLETSEAAKWLKIKPRRLLANSKGQCAKIPGFWLNERVVRYNPRTIIAKLAHDAGVPQKVIAASFTKI